MASMIRNDQILAAGEDVIRRYTIQKPSSIMMHVTPSPHRTAPCSTALRRLFGVGGTQCRMTLQLGYSKYRLINPKNGIADKQLDDRVG